MKWIVITLPEFIRNEAGYIEQLFESGIDLLHLRKPEASLEDYENLIQKIDAKWYPQIVIHEHFELCEKYQLHGIHLNKRNSGIPKDYKGHISRSCHNFQEVTAALNIPSKENPEGNAPASKSIYDYVFLSPIFDSISKKDYRHSFTNKDLEDAAYYGIINEKVIALGGVIPEFIPQLRAWNFGGAAFLGAVWNERHKYDWPDYLNNIQKRLTPSKAKNTLNGSNIW